MTEIPYQVNKAALITRIAELVQDKTIDGISDIRDESDKSGMRIVIELKKDVNANVILNRLYKHTQMQETFGVIILALVDNEPRVLNLKELLHYYIEHQKDVIVRRTRLTWSGRKRGAHTGRPDYRAGQHRRSRGADQKSPDVPTAGTA